VVARIILGSFRTCPGPKWSPKPWSRVPCSNSSTLPALKWTGRCSKPSLSHANRPVAASGQDCQPTSGGVSFVMTLCSVDPKYQNTEVAVARPRGVTEPAITWTSASRMYDTQALRRQLGATGNSTSLADRGIYALEQKANLAATTTSQCDRQGLCGLLIPRIDIGSPGGRCGLRRPHQRCLDLSSEW
jgi:hypothetical protein